MNTNVNSYQIISDIFEAVSSPARLQIVLAIGTGESCVCHLEAQLRMRQAYISQQLMVLREKDLITARREGKYIYYRLQSLKLMEIIRSAAELAGVEEDWSDSDAPIQCDCPKCSPERSRV